MRVRLKEDLLIATAESDDERRAVAEWSGRYPQAKAALLSTGERPLVHRVRRDSRTVPGVVMADIWTSVRKGLANRQVVTPETGQDEGHD